MDPCELIDQWETLTAQERLDELEALINEYLVDNGYLPITAEISDLDHALGDFDKNTGKVRFDTDHIEGSRPDGVLDTAMHEMGHAMEAQDGDYAALSDDERAQYNDEFIVEDDTMDFEENDFHPDIEDFAAYLTDRLLNDCQSSSSPAAGDVYGSGQSAPFEMEIGPAVISDAPAEDADAGSEGDSFTFDIDVENAVFSSGENNE
jgi:hypothetical protein